MDSHLSARLRAVGIEPEAIADPAGAWRRLHDAHGTRATLLDRYALEASARGVRVEDLERELRAVLAHEVLAAHAPGFELVGGSDRSAADPVEVVPYDLAWPIRFAEWRDRLGRELGAAAFQIEHVGSTAVPGLPAKPVVDIQVSVLDVEDEDSYAPHVERAGVALRARETGHRYFRPSGDRPREVQVHVCGTGSDWEDRHLLFRDYLRADAATRDAYAALKEELAARHRYDRIAYNGAKTNFILDALERAHAWRRMHARERA